MAPVCVRTRGRLLLSLIMSVLITCLAAAGLSCAVPPVSTSLLLPAPGMPLVARKIQTPLTIVLDPDNVPDSFVIAGLGKQITVDGVSEFVRRDLKLAMQNFFLRVDVISPEERPMPGSHMADIRIDRFDAQGNFSSTPGVGMGAQVSGRMTWAFAILPAGGRDYLFSFSEISTGDVPLVGMRQAPTMVEGTYRVGLEHLVRDFVESGAYQNLLSLEDEAHEATSPPAHQPEATVEEPTAAAPESTEDSPPTDDEVAEQPDR